MTSFDDEGAHEDARPEREQHAARDDGEKEGNQGR
jgi:hypothetical protein